jgi:aryl-alcohol dehydrogenase-like predicted oxidoreductase
MRKLGRTDLFTAPIVFGGNVFGWTADEPTSLALLDAFLDAGFNCVDTADVYSRWAPGNKGGESETIIGNWMKQRGTRRRVVLATKIGNEMGPDRKGLSKAYILRGVEDSLKRLQTDYIDLYQSHRDDNVTPVGETLEAYAQLVKEGKVRAVGASNYTAERLAALHTAAHSNGIVPYTVLQNEYNLVERDSYGPDLQRLCQERGIAMLPWFGLAAGFLTGKYRTREDLTRFNRGSSIERFFDKGLTVLPVLDAVAAETGASHGAVALAWLMRQPSIAAPIASASKPEQLDVQFEALTLDLSEDQLARLTAAGGCT